MQFNALKIFLGGSAPKNPTGGIGGLEDPPSPTDPSAIFGRANARFPDWGLATPIVIFYSAPC